MAPQKLTNFKNKKPINLLKKIKSLIFIPTRFFYNNIPSHEPSLCQFHELSHWFVLQDGSQKLQTPTTCEIS